MFTSHTINSCKGVLHDYGEFNNFVDHMLTSMEEEISESDKVEQMVTKLSRIRSELESVYKELKIAIAARDDKKP
jgi:hypothetical protein